MSKVLILLAPDADGLTAAGQTLLQEFKISYQLRVSSAQTAAAYAQDIITSFQKAGGQAIICLAAPQDHLASVAAASSTLPVLHVLISPGPVSWESGPLPIAHLGAGAGGFTQAVLFVLQLLSLQDMELAQNLQRHRHSLAARVIAADHKQRVMFDV